MVNDERPGLDQPQLLCETIAELVDTLEDDDVLTEDEASDLRSQVYQAVDLGGHPTEEVEEE